MIRQFELVERIKAYDPNVEEDALNRAYVFAMKAHGSQVRASGDPYFSHPLEVAGILTGYRLDGSSIITALLHDTVEDTLATLDEIESLFGEEVAKLVDGVTKLSLIELQSDHAKQAENFRKLLLAMSDDIRVLMVKLADRLHNMRTLNFLKNPAKRLRIATETMEIYAPLAERIGMQEMKNELDDLAFAEINADARNSIMKRLDFLRNQGEGLVERIQNELRRTLAAASIHAVVNGREKTAYSIWRKMKHKDVEFEQLSDIMAFRIIVDSVDDCYRTLGVMHNAYRVVPGRFKDYISTPKPNGYQSLHTGIYGPERHRIEIQIRTQDMHDVAENGVAAHWQYKQGGETRAREGRQYRWLRELLDILEHASGPEEFLEHTKLEMFQDQVFCFTPKGDIRNLPQGATPVDFAYAVHSEVGDTCVGAKINGRMMPLRTRLKNGDQVEILTSKAQKPSPTWERFVVTGKARARIRRFIRLKERDQYLELGKAMLTRAFKEEGYEATDKALKGVLRIFQRETTDDLTAEVGMGNITSREVLEAVYPGTKKKSAKVVPLAPVRVRHERNAQQAKNAIPVRGLIPGMAVHYAGCCHPLPGDRIVGIITTGKGVTIHTIDCEKLEALADQPERWIDVSWDMDRGELDGSHVSRVFLTVLNMPGTLSDLSTVIAKNTGNISNLKIVNRSADFFDLMIDIEVKDVTHLAEIMAALRASPVVNTIERARG
ncbi:RelA/SpoT family protein [Varunaivibrio sulfuroxidans]|uniref:GTP pyrophosphokinase rsh n=1 Tax=Varunaivibrio sulfuroxidans TaxID=1773489 RepID=A0A4R3JEJ5_9PROT|nr:bifunctional (p)ppGpp synthetase/guanosine-3',5'-bis(diphosphate) 3'-pyrophosphohydrolase [Varunaivibrio sulfuroxidans]TCS64224.1 GTP pyrophosphokinase [Varunaivibrio sulfuroxidans]WES31335.1 bifunctional (p)ppGpp synthetase/guanosine-3',5'-bis(diphosphate) 3'-pyrophosphohydrolase [Varunaivibrio sulfuroxidans]